MTNGVVPQPVQSLTLSETCEETLPPPHRSPSPPPAVHPKNFIGIIPASQLKRKHNFELVIEVPSKKLKPLRYPQSSTSSGNPMASSSRSVPNKSVTTATGSSVWENRTRQRNIRKATGTHFKVTLDPQIRDATVTRAFMNAHFRIRLSNQFCQLPQDKADHHGYDHFVFVSKVNSCSLLTPVFGSHGSICTARFDSSAFCPRRTWAYNSS